MKKKVADNEIIRNDITLYKKNSQAANFALLGIAFNCIYFIIMYGVQCGNIIAKFKDGSFVYTWINGMSVIVNLAVLLTVFLCSEKIKNYKWQYSIVLWVVAAVQIARIFVYPLITFSGEVRQGLNYTKVFGASTLVLLIVSLGISAACLIYSGVIGFIRAKKRQSYISGVESGEIDIQGALNEHDALAGDIHDETAVADSSEETAVADSSEETSATDGQEVDNA